MEVYYTGSNENRYCEIIDLKLPKTSDEKYKNDLIITISTIDGIKSFSLMRAYGKSIYSDDRLLKNDYDQLSIKLNEMLSIFQLKRENELIKENKMVLYEFLQSNYGFDGFTHETTINNLVKILVTGKLLCRNSAKNFDDIANPEVLEHTMVNVKKYVRLYFGYKTPTNYIFDSKNDDRMCYIVFNFNIVDLPSSYFTDGNAASKYTSFHDIRKYLLDGDNLMDWKSIFERGYLPNKYPIIPLPFPDSYEEKKRKRCAEILVKGSIDVKYIDRLIFKTEIAKNTFINNLKNDIILNEIRNKIIVNPEVFY